MFSEPSNHLQTAQLLKKKPTMNTIAVSCNFCSKLQEYSMLAVAQGSGAQHLTLQLFRSLVAWFPRIDLRDSRESGDSRESEIRVIRANRPDAL